MGNLEVKRAYRAGYQAGWEAGKYGATHHHVNRRHKEPKIGYGLTAGQMAVIKMSVNRFNCSYKLLAKRYKVTENAIRHVVESVQFADIKERGIS